MSEKRAERLQVMLTQEEVQAVDEWRFENRMPSRSAAARALMNLGLSVKRGKEGQDELIYRPVASGDIGIVDNAPQVDAVIKSDTRPVILLADGDLVLARGIGSLLEEQGYKVVGPATTTDEAIALSREEEPVAAVLEIMFGQERVDKLADELTRRHIPCLFCTTDDARHDLPERLRSLPVVNKRNVVAELSGAVTSMLSNAADMQKRSPA